MKKTEAQNPNLSLTEVVSAAVQIPGVKVNREDFLRLQFKKEPLDQVARIIEEGPVKSGYDRATLRKMAQKIINDRTVFSTAASFAAGLPGGLTMAAAIPADLMQFYGVALRVAQELAYLYGEPDLWNGERLDDEKVTNQLILYCGVMLGASGAAQAVRVLSSSLAKQMLKKIPQKALTKTFYYPIIKSVVKAFGGKMTKKVFAQGMSKAVPVIGGVVSGGITFATMRPMGMRLLDTLDEAHFDYTPSEFEEDWKDIVEVCEEQESPDLIDSSADYPDEICQADGSAQESIDNDQSLSAQNAFDEIKNAKKLQEMGVITEEEFAQIKKKIISRMA